MGFLAAFFQFPHLAFAAFDFGFGFCDVEAATVGAELDFNAAG
jgi:hypothetical protein